MPGMSIHVVDVTRGVVAVGMVVEVAVVLPGGARRVFASGKISGMGTLDHPALAGVLKAAPYQAVFHVADYYAAAGVPLPGLPFLGVVTYDFGIDDPKQHYHLPFKCTPWGYSCFRGGA